MAARAKQTSPEAKRILALGLRNRWYGICPADFVGAAPVALKRWGERLVAWRDTAGVVHLQEDRCPHRGAALSLARHLGDRLACVYHGVEVTGDGTVAAMPGVPSCDLVGQRAVRTYPTVEFRGVIFAWHGDALHPDPTPFEMPEQLDSEAYDAFLSYGEWGCPYRFMIDNNMDPMHGIFLHQVSHSMSEGERDSQFRARQTETGFMFEKKGQRDINFDWSEWYDTGFQFVRLEIPYPATGGPGGNFGIIFHITPIDETTSACFFWRNRKVSGWQRDVWRFLYKNRLEARHWQVLEQDRRVMEATAPDADAREYLYEHDVGLVRVRRLLAEEAERQVAALKKARLPI